MKYLVYQIHLSQKTQEGNNTYHHWNTIIRNVEASNKEAAIGKFVIQTSKITAVEKLPLTCILLEQLIKLK